MPSSRAISAPGRPEDSSNRTASSLNSLVNRFRAIMDALPGVLSPNSVSTKPGLPQPDPVSFGEVGLGEPVQARAAQEDLPGDVAADGAQQIARHIGEVGVEVRVIGRDAHAIGADEPG